MEKTNAYDNEIKVSVIIVSYNNYGMLKECIESILLYNDIGSSLEIIVSDNSPNPSIIENINRDFPTVKTIKNNNIGFGAGNNKGFRASKGEFILFLNPDTILIEPIFKFTIEKFYKNENLALFGVQLVNKNLGKNDSFFLMDDNRLLSILFFKLFKHMSFYIDKRMYISGANIFVRRTCFEKSGKFDEKMFMYYEEPDLIKRIKLVCNCNKTSFFKSKRIIHLEGATEKDSIESYVNKISRNLDTYSYYCRKWNICFEKNVKCLLNYEKIKLFLYKMKRNHNKIELSHQLIELYEQRILQRKETSI